MKLFFTVFAAILAAAAVIYGARSVMENNARREEAVAQLNNLRAEAVAATLARLDTLDGNIDKFADMATSTTSLGDRRMAMLQFDRIRTGVDLEVQRFPKELNEKGVQIKKHLHRVIEAAQLSAR